MLSMGVFIDIVIPAKAGIQVVNLTLRSMFTTWVPAFAGMTVPLST